MRYYCAEYAEGGDTLGLKTPKLVTVFDTESERDSFVSKRECWCLTKDDKEVIIIEGQQGSHRTWVF